MFDQLDCGMKLWLYELVVTYATYEWCYSQSSWNFATHPRKPRVDWFAPNRAYKQEKCFSRHSLPALIGTVPDTTKPINQNNFRSESLTQSIDPSTEGSSTTNSISCHRLYCRRNCSKHEAIFKQKSSNLPSGVTFCSLSARSNYWSFGGVVEGMRTTRCFIDVYPGRSPSRPFKCGTYRFGF